MALASTIEYEITLSSAIGRTEQPEFRGDANSIDLTITVSEAIGRSTITTSTGTANPIQLDIQLSHAVGVAYGSRADANPIRYAIGLSPAGAGGRFTGDANPIRYNIQVGFTLASKEVVRLASSQEIVSISDSNLTQAYMKFLHSNSLEWQTFVQFSLSHLPPQSVVRFATLVCTQRAHANPSGEPAIVSEVRPITGGWTRSGVTLWDNRPAVGNTIDTSIDDNDTAFLLTDLVQEWIDGTTPNYGVRISQTTVDSRVNREFYGASTIPERRPYLLVQFEDDVLEQYGGVENHVTPADNRDVYNRHTMQDSLIRAGDRPYASILSQGMIYWTDGRMDLDMGGGWKTLLAPNTGLPVGGIHTLGDQSYQATSGTHTHPA